MERFNVKVDNYGSLIVSTKDSRIDSRGSTGDVFSSFDMIIPNGNLGKCAKSSRQPVYVLNKLFFTSNCESNEDDNTQSLILNGDVLNSKIGRRLNNSDVPYLSIFLVENKNVVKLNLANNEIDCAGFIGLISHIIKNGNVIRELDMRNNKISDTGINFIFHHRSNLELKILRLRGNKIGAENAKKVARAVANNKYIEYLDVAEIDQNESSLIFFLTILRSDLKFGNILKILDLSRPNPQCKYSKLDSQHIAETIGTMLRYNRTLEELYLQKFNFSCHDIEDMYRNAKYNKTLKLLDLCCNNIGDYGVKFFAEWFQKCCPLETLLLGHNIISNQGIKAVNETVVFSKLTRLDVSRNRIDDYSCAELFYAILKIPSISKIKVYGNNIGPLTAEVIEKLLQLRILEQENIDVKLYRVDGKSYIAYYDYKQTH